MLRAIVKKTYDCATEIKQYLQLAVGQEVGGNE